MKSFAATLLIAGAAASKPSHYKKAYKNVIVNHADHENGLIVDGADDGANNGIIFGAPQIISCADGTKMKCNAGT